MGSVQDFARPHRGRPSPAGPLTGAPLVPVMRGHVWRARTTGGLSCSVFATPPTLHATASASLITGVIVAGVFGAAPAATAAVTTMNPFEANGGFTVVSLGDATLGNGELEGSVAALGAISSTSGNFPIQHDVVSDGSYSVPVIERNPVRVLAGSLTGTGMIQIANRSTSGSAGSADASASVKLGDVTGISVQSRSGGVGPAAGGEFARLTNAVGGVIDLLAVPHASDALDGVRTAAPVASYIDAAKADAAAAALAAAYGTESVHVVPLAIEGGLVYPLSFSADRPNVIDYADVADKTIKLERSAATRRPRRRR